jgi:bacteriorhodopsin
MVKPLVKPLAMILAAAVLVGPVLPDRDKAQTVVDMRQLDHGHSRWHWLALGASVAATSVLVLKAGEAKPLPNKTLYRGPAIPPGGY